MKAASIGFGVFMGILPVWGFQLAIAIAVAIWLRLNKALVVVAANISIPPMIPLVLFLSHRVGAWWMGDQAQRIEFSNDITLQQVRKSLVQYLAGATSLAIMAGVAFALVSFLLLKIFRKR